MKASKILLFYAQALNLIFSPLFTLSLVVGVIVFFHTEQSWAQGNVRGAIEALVKMNDLPVSIFTPSSTNVVPLKACCRLCKL